MVSDKLLYNVETSIYNAGAEKVPCFMEAATLKKKKCKNCKKINYKRTKTINLISLQSRCVHLKGEEVGKDDDVPWKWYQWGSWFMHAGSSAWAQIIMAVCWQD